MKNFINEFKQFALKGSVIDLAVGVVVGAAFQKIVTSVVTDIITPAIGFLTGNINLTTLAFGPFNIGDLLQSTIDFIIIAFAIFLAIKVINLMRRKEAKQSTPTVTPSREEILLTEIRDALRGKPDTTAKELVNATEKAAAADQAKN
jgi:large conductance mechanosensitive channel